MQILHFIGYATIGRLVIVYRVAKFAGFVNLFISSNPQINIFSAEFIIAFYDLYYLRNCKMLF